MIQLENVTKIYHTAAGPRKVLRDVSLSIERGEKIGILGRNGSGKSTLLRIIGGVEKPSTGSITRSMSVSWPLAFTGAFQGSLTGRDNVKFVCRIYGINLSDVMPFVESFADLGVYMREPLKTYSSGMRARLAFAISMAIEFDCFLIDEVIAVGDSRFHEKCKFELFERRSDRSMVLVSHDPHYIRSYCDSALVLIDGVLYKFDCLDKAFDFYTNPA